MKIALLTVATAGLAVFCSAANIAGEPKNKRAAPQVARQTPANLRPMTPLAIETMLIERRKASWHEMQKPLPPYEEESQHQIAALEIKKQLHEKSLISKLELQNSERAVADLRSERERIRESSAEEEQHTLLPVEKGAGKNQSRRRSPRRGSRAKPALIRYDGAANWTIDGVEKIGTFFHGRFGRPLPISALGQSPTHDRLGLDHSDAVDVAVRPDSPEGRALMAYLRAAGIPFIAFRGRISRMSTGAHIHIGPPSPRLVVAQRRSKSAAEPEDAAEQS